jgi:hypothetical protein
MAAQIIIIMKYAFGLWIRVEWPKTSMSRIVIQVIPASNPMPNRIRKK